MPRIPHTGRGGGCPTVSNIITIICEITAKPTVTAFLKSRAPSNRAMWRTCKRPEGMQPLSVRFRILSMQAFKNPASSPVPFPPPFFFLFLSFCLLSKSFTLAVCVKLFTCIIFQCFTNRKKMRFYRKNSVFFFTDTNKIRIFVIQKTRDN